MILPDWKIQKYVGDGRIEIDPFSFDQLQPHSYDLRLGKDLLLRTGYHNEIATHKLPQNLYMFALGTTLERIKLPDNICAQVDGKSTLGRLGLSVHQTAGWIDAGFNGNITLELNTTDDPVHLEEGMRI